MPITAALEPAPTLIPPILTNMGGEEGRLLVALAKELKRGLLVVAIAPTARVPTCCDCCICNCGCGCDCDCDFCAAKRSKSSCSFAITSPCWLNSLERTCISRARVCTVCHSDLIFCPGLKGAGGAGGAEEAC